MITALYRIIKYGLKNFWRQRLISLATLTIIVLALFVFQSLLIVNPLGKNLLEHIQDKLDISIYFKTNVPEDEILTIKKSLEALAEIKSVEYISREAALIAFRERHADDKDGTILRGLDELSENPLSASLTIKAKDPSDYDKIEAHLKAQNLDALLDTPVTDNNNQLVIQRLTSIIDLMKSSGIILTIVLSLVAIVVAFNTILLAIYSNREEIGIMRLVGASNTFIRGPFIVEGILYGVIASILSVLITLPIIYSIAPYLTILPSNINLWNFYLGNFASLFFSQLLFGVLIGVISSLIAIRKYLKI